MGLAQDLKKKRGRRVAGPWTSKKKRSPLWARKPAQEPKKEVVATEKRSRRREPGIAPKPYKTL